MLSESGTWVSDGVMGTGIVSFPASVDWDFFSVGTSSFSHDIMVVINTNMYNHPYLFFFLISLSNDSFSQFLTKVGKS